MARLALEMSHVHRLAALVTDKAELLKELAIQRQSYQDELKERTLPRNPQGHLSPIHLPLRRSMVGRPPLRAARSTGSPTRPCRGDCLQRSPTSFTHDPA